MSFSVGIAIITYNRKPILSPTIECVQAFTRHPDAALVIADDGSTDGTQEMLREKRVPFVTGLNMGIAWNKNRALYLLGHMLCCETVILLEDDTQPNSAGWEEEWIRAAKRWGHVNLAGDWMPEKKDQTGSGTADDPIRSSDVTAQCSAFSREALGYGGYFDPRFKGYGHEHVEHSRRLIRAGYGGTDTRVDGEEKVRFASIKSHLAVAPCQGHRNEEQMQRNNLLAQQAMSEDHFRAPWLNDPMLRQFRAEIESAMREGPERFRLTPAPQPAGRKPTGGVFARLFGRR
jgi:glycosyltransferase involved in cell wall biosynthesis